MITKVRKIVRSGSTNYVAIPASTLVGKTATLAAQRFILIDPLGEVREDRLGAFLKFLEENFEKIGDSNG